jgi:homoserine kinase
MTLSAVIANRASASVPGGIGNIGPGLDVLGCALSGPRDEITVEWSDVPGITLRDAGHPDLPRNPARHTGALAAAAVLRAARRENPALPDRGLVMDVRKGLPLSGGQGGSAASAVAGAVAANALLGSPLDHTQILNCCLVAEEKVAGRHLDNIAPSLFGGIVLIRSLDPIDLVRLPVPEGLRIVIAHPAQRLATARARGVLPATVTRAVAQHQMAQVGALVAACYTGDIALFGRSIDDRIAEPVRSTLLPGFVDAKHAALEAGALGVSISGAGPSAFAIVADETVGAEVARAMTEAYARHEIVATTRVTTVDRDGAITRIA